MGRMTTLRPLLVARALTHVPTWALVCYVIVMALMAVGLTARFLTTMRTRPPTRPGGAGPAALLVILFFPLLAISLAWPVTLPVVAVVLWREQRGTRPPPRAFEVLPPEEEMAKPE
ncbi:MAG: hypothetical protein JWO31_401 [Phycisphaerales bacterium]|nr:hypothetical protein [Phycisphaerales bacterium]